MKLLTIFRLAFNCFLVALAFRQLAQPHELALRREPRLDLSRSSVSLPARASTPQANVGTTWGRLEASDPARFIANLRAVGCPERTIRDIVVLRVCRSYRSQLIAMETESARTHGYVRNRTLVEWRDSNQQRTQLRNAMQSELESLLGLKASDLAWAVLGWSTAEPSADFISAEKRARIRDSEARFQKLIADAGADQLYGAGDAEAQQRRRELEREKQAALATLLSPSELEEYLMRESPGARYVRDRLPAAQSESEFRAMVKVALEFEMTIDAGTSAARYEGFQQRLREVLGEDRVAEQRRQEEVRQADEEAQRRQQQEQQARLQLAEATESVGLTTEDANRLMDRLNELKPVLDAKFDALGKILNARPEEKAAKMKEAIKAELQRVALETVGDKGPALVEKMISENQ